MGQGDAVTPDEAVFRRIPKSRFHEGDDVPVDPVAFRPREDDIEGLSVYRAKKVGPREVALAYRMPGDCFVARLAVADLLDLHLSVVPDERPDELPGHALIPELSWGRYQADKGRSKGIQFALASLASKAIELRPGEALNS